MIRRRNSVLDGGTISSATSDSANNAIEVQQNHERFHRRGTATGAVTYSDSGMQGKHQRQYQSFNNPGAHNRRLRLEDHLCAIQEDLINEMAQIYIQDRRVCPSSDFYGLSEQQHHDDHDHHGGLSPCSTTEASVSGLESVIKETKSDDEANNQCVSGEDDDIDPHQNFEYVLAVSSVRDFIKSLPPRYVLSIDSPHEALIHMRHLASVKRDPLNARIHITGFDFCESLTFGTTAPNNLKTIFICCDHTIGLMEFLMGILVSGGNEIFDSNFLLSSDKIMLIRCVINEKGVTRLDDLQQQLSIYIQAAKGIPCNPRMSESLPVPTQIGTFDPTKVHYQPYPNTIMRMDEDPSFVDDISPPAPLGDMIGLESEKNNAESRYMNARFLARNGITLSDVKVPDELDDAGMLGLRKEYNFFHKIIVDGSIRSSPEIEIYRGRLLRKEKENIYALKAYKINETNNNQTQDVIREIKVATTLSHENICKFVDVIQTKTHICVAYEFCSMGPLSRIVINKEIDYDYLPIAQDISNGMAYLHSKNVIHRDLKPENILIDCDGRAKVADFNLSITHTGAEELTGETGTYRWMAPEVIRHEPYSINSDIYSFSLVLWQLITRKIPFHGYTPLQAAFAVARDGERPQIPDHIPEYIGRIITSCWDQDQLKRPSFAKVSLALQVFKFST